MFGYIIATFLGLVVVLIALSVLTRSGPRTGRRAADEKPVGFEQPAADEPTPGRSDTASTAEAEAARRVTPPA